MENGEFEIDGMIVTANTKIEEFEILEKYDVYRGSGKIASVDSAPNTVNFINGEFLVDFIFGDGKIRRIELRPIITDYEEPNYPDEKYQEYQWNYCKKMLKESFGEASEENELKSVYEFDGGAIFTSKIMGGKAAYTGGNIIIHFGR